MKVSELILLLEPYKDKNLYMANFSAVNDVTGVKTQLIDDDFLLSFEQKIDHKFITEFHGLKEGFSSRLRNEEEVEALRKAQIRESRQFNYCFDEGSQVMIDEEVLLNTDKEKWSHLFGKIGIVKKCSWDIHAYGQGRSYYHIIEWENGETTQDGDFGDNAEIDPNSFMPKNFIPTIYLKSAQK